MDLCFLSWHFCKKMRVQDGCTVNFLSLGIWGV